MCGKGNDKLLKTVLVWGAAGAFLALGVFDILRYKKSIAVLDEIISFVRFTQGELRFRSADYYSIMDNAKAQDYKYLHIKDNSITVDGVCNGNTEKDFQRFLQRIGTTDTQGQLLLCEEYLHRFGAAFDEQKDKEKNRLQVNAAISILSAVCVLVLFI